MSSQEERHAENITRLVRLEMNVEAIKEDVAHIKTDLKPLREAFQQAKGFKAGLMVVGLFLMSALGAGAREIFSWVTQIFGKH